MVYYWRVGDIPELQEMQPADRYERWRVARERVWQGRVLRWACLTASVLVYTGAKGIDDRLHLSLFAGLLVVLAIAGTVIWSLDVLCLQPRARQWLRTHLHEFRTDDSAAPVEMPRP